MDAIEFLQKELAGAIGIELGSKESESYSYRESHKEQRIIEIDRLIRRAKG